MDKLDYQMVMTMNDNTTKIAPSMNTLSLDAGARQYSVYIAGPMTGYDDLNFPAFHMASKRWRDGGWEVHSPAEFGEHAKWEWIDYMIRDMERLVKCDAIALLEGWQKSRGAGLEKVVAEYLQIHVFQASHVVPAHPHIKNLQEECCTVPAHGHAAAILTGKTWRDF